MYRFTFETQDDEGRTVYNEFEVCEGDSFTDTDGRNMMVTVAEYDRVIVCENGSGENPEEWLSDSELARHFKPVSVKVATW